MRHALGLALMVLSITSSGCALVQDSCQNVLVGIKTPIEEHREKARNRQWAETAWQQVCVTNPGRFSQDYATGFKDGFAEYLFRGGDGEPPLVAPLRYRDSRYQNEQGYHAVQDWFAGYRHGAAMARDSGARKWITGPSSLQAEIDGLHVHEGPPPAPDRPTPEKTAPIPLPEPKVVPKADAAPGSIAPAPPAKTAAAEPAATAPIKAQLAQPRVQPMPDDAAPPLPEALRRQILRMTEAAKNEGPRPEADRPAPEKAAPVPLPEPKVAPAAGAEQTSIEPASPIRPETAVAAPMPVQLDRPRVQQAPLLDDAGPPLPEALRLQIRRITEAARMAPAPPSNDGTEAETKIRITGIHDAPPVRARITGIIATPQKD